MAKKRHLSNLLHLDRVHYTNYDTPKNRVNIAVFCASNFVNGQSKLNVVFQPFENRPSNSFR